MFIKYSKIEIGFLLCALIIFMIFLLGSIFSESRIFDEGLHVDAGYAFLTRQDFAKEPFNPPLARELIALPALLHKQSLLDPLLVQERMVVVMISCLLLICLYIFTRTYLGVHSAIFAVVLYIFNPEILAHSHYASTDIILTFFIFLSLFLFILWREKFTSIRIVTLGITIGCALSAKVSAIPFLILSFVSIFFYDLWYKKIKIDLFCWKKICQGVLLITVMCISLWSTYFFTFESALGENFIPHNNIVKQLVAIPGVNFFLSHPIPLGGYIRTIKQVILYNYSSIYGKPAFLLGSVYSQGVWYFYPLAYLLKTPLPLLIMLILSFRYNKNKQKHYLLLPIVAIFLSAMMSTLNLGIRYILPVYPLIFVFVAQLISPNIQFPKKNIILTILLAWYIAGTLSVTPHYLSFMNEITGKTTYKYRFLIDSNYDWGQGLVALKKYQNTHHINNLQLAYFGMVNPHWYGVVYQRILDVSYGDNTKVRRTSLQKGSTIAISASCYWYCGYYKEKAFKNKIPTSIVGGSILVFTF